MIIEYIPNSKIIVFTLLFARIILTSKLLHDFFSLQDNFKLPFGYCSRGVLALTQLTNAQHIYPQNWHKIEQPEFSQEP